VDAEPGRAGHADLVERSDPYISKPSDLARPYLGPYFNVLPIIAVGLMLFQQQKMMPKSDDPQVQQQQKMMKYMMIISASSFTSGVRLCLYFITSTLWGLMERKFLPKPVKPEEWTTSRRLARRPPVAALARRSRGASETAGWFGRKKQHLKERWKEVPSRRKSSRNTAAIRQRSRR